MSDFYREVWALLNTEFLPGGDDYKQVSKDINNVIVRRIRNDLIEALTATIQGEPVIDVYEPEGLAHWCVNYLLNGPPASADKPAVVADLSVVCSPEPEPRETSSWPAPHPARRWVGLADPILASDAEIARRVRKCRPCTSGLADSANYVHAGESYDDGCWQYAGTLLRYLRDGEL